MSAESFTRREGGMTILSCLGDFVHLVGFGARRARFHFKHASSTISVEGLLEAAQDRINQRLSKTGPGEFRDHGSEFKDVPSKILSLSNTYALAAGFKPTHSGFFCHSVYTF